MSMRSSAPPLLAWWHNLSWRSFSLSPRGDTLTADLARLLLLGALENHIIPFLTSSSILIDLISPWLMVSFVTMPGYKIFLFLILGSLLVETSSSAPLGIYFCGYWMIAAVIVLARATLSWRQVAPWFATFFLGIFWLIQLELFFLFVRQDPSQLDIYFFLNQVARLGIGCLAGLAFAWGWILRYRGEAIDP